MKTLVITALLTLICVGCAVKVKQGGCKIETKLECPPCACGETKK